MAIPDGYKIYWGTDADNLNGVHPVNTSYNSPIEVVGGDVGTYTLPSDFQHTSLPEIYFSVAAYSGTEDGVASTPIALMSCERTLDNGEYGFCFPLDDGNTYTPKQLLTSLGATRVAVRKIGQSSYSSYISFSTDGDVLVLSDEILIKFAAAKTIKWHGIPWQQVD